MTKIAIIGGWAAGMMVAATLLEREDWAGEILLFEKNSRLGAKVLISGGGRCNLTTWIIKRQDLKQYYTRGWGFLEDSMKKFWPRAVRKWFESHGVPCKEEDDHRVFPVSNRGEDIVNIFQKIFTEYSVPTHRDKKGLERWERKSISIHFNEGVVNIQLDTLRQKAQDDKIDDGENKFIITTGKGTYTVDKVVITTGGNAFVHTGSSGDGYTFARALGHHITPLWPSLNSFETLSKEFHKISWISFQDCVIRCSLMKRDGKWVDVYGSMLFTHFGITWPAVFQIASHTAFETVDKAKWKSLFLFLQPLDVLLMLLYAPKHT